MWRNQAINQEIYGNAWKSMEICCKRISGMSCSFCFWLRGSLGLQQQRTAQSFMVLYCSCSAWPNLIGRLYPWYDHTVYGFVMFGQSDCQSSSSACFLSCPTLSAIASSEILHCWSFLTLSSCTCSASKRHVHLKLHKPTWVAKTYDILWPVFVKENMCFQY